MDTPGQVNNDFDEISNSEIVSIQCGGCGADTIMNSIYGKHVQGLLLSCRHCRQPGPART
jgi:hypothetical protein